MTKKQRSYCMSQIRSKDTKPEILLRKLVWAAGGRGYRLHRKIKGKPDVYFGTKKIAIFLDGCFWHGCPKCGISPKTNSRFWKKKFLQNSERDIRVNAELRRQKIKVLRFWEHQLNKSPEKVMLKVKKVLNAVSLSQKQ